MEKVTLNFLSKSLLILELFSNNKNRNCCTQDYCPSLQGQPQWLNRNKTYRDKFAASSSETESEVVRITQTDGEKRDPSAVWCYPNGPESIAATCWYNWYLRRNGPAASVVTLQYAAELGRLSDRGWPDWRECGARRLRLYYISFLWFIIMQRIFFFWSGSDILFESNRFFQTFYNDHLGGELCCAYSVTTWRFQVYG